MKPSPAGKVPNTDLPISFETVALPVARAKKMGIIAMKIFGQDALVGAAPANKLLHYSLSLPVTTAVVGMPKLEHLEENVQLARGFKALPRTRDALPVQRAVGEIQAGPRSARCTSTTTTSRSASRAGPIGHPPPILEGSHAHSPLVRPRWVPTACR